MNWIIGIIIGAAVLVFMGSIFLPLSVILKIILFVFPIIFLVAAAIVVFVSVFKKSTSETGKRPIFFQVPMNHVWILRNVWGSDPATQDGYEEKTEGWSFWIPTILHADEGLIDLTPVQLDIDPITINCTDGNDAIVDVRATYFVRDESGAATKFLLNTDKEKVDELVKQRVKVAFNTAMSETSATAIEWGAPQKKQYALDAQKIVCELLKDDNGKDYGLEVGLNVENIAPTPAVRVAADRRAAAKMEIAASIDEGTALKQMITDTGANPTIVLLAERIMDTVSNIWGGKSGGKKEVKSEVKTGGKKA
ncbi:MAG: SPFH domain-containing protein [Patescibacteria group bacterium]